MHHKIFINIFLISIAINSIFAKKSLRCNLDFDNNCIFKSASIGNNEEISFDDFRNDAVTKIVFESSSVHSVPAKLFQEFENLKSLKISRQNVKEIKENSYLSAGKLENLLMNENQVNQLKRNIFQGANNLKALSICCGEIRVVDKDAFSNLKKLKFLDISTNQIKSLDKNLFKNLVNLRNLFLHTNQIEFIHKDLFASNVNLLEIYLRNNQISAMSPDTFAHLNQLETLHLYGNVCINKNYFGASRKISDVENDLAFCSRNYETNRKKDSK